MERHQRRSHHRHLRLGSGSGSGCLRCGGENEMALHPHLDPRSIKLHALRQPPYPRRSACAALRACCAPTYFSLRLCLLQQESDMRLFWAKWKVRYRKNYGKNVRGRQPAAGVGAAAARAAGIGGWGCAAGGVRISANRIMFAYCSAAERATRPSAATATRAGWHHLSLLLYQRQGNVAGAGQGGCLWEPTRQLSSKPSS